MMSYLCPPRRSCASAADAQGNLAPPPQDNLTPPPKANLKRQGAQLFTHNTMKRFRERERKEEREIAFAAGYYDCPIGPPPPPPQIIAGGLSLQSSSLWAQASHQQQQQQQQQYRQQVSMVPPPPPHQLPEAMISEIASAAATAAVAAMQPSSSAPVSPTRASETSENSEHVTMALYDRVHGHEPYPHRKHHLHFVSFSRLTDHGFDKEVDSWTDCEHNFGRQIVNHKDFETNRCFGHNGRILLSVVRHDNFEIKLQDVKEKIKHQARTQAQPFFFIICVVSICNRLPILGHPNPSGGSHRTGCVQTSWKVSVLDGLAVT